jgi:hypothetical protein
MTKLVVMTMLRSAARGSGFMGSGDGLIGKIRAIDEAEVAEDSRSKRIP